MRASEVLTEYETRLGELEAKQVEIIRTMTTLDCMNATFQQYGRAAAHITDRSADLIAEYGEQLEAVSTALDNFIAARKDALKLIQRLESPAHREILLSVYMAGSTIYDFAKRKDIPERTAYSRHDAALALLDAICDLQVSQ